VGDKPVISLRTYYTAEYKGEEYKVRILADPYIYPEKIDGYFYVLINSWAVDMPNNNRGCQLMFRSKDMINWEPYKIAIITDDLDRLETAQIWEHNGKWYMSFGGCYVDPEKGGLNNLWNDNFVYMADSFDGPYEKQEWSRLVYEGAATRPYTQKQIKDPYGDDVMLASAPYEGVLWPYKIVYGEDGSVTLVPVGK
jgi:beta-fructofuranosidase